MGNRRNVVASTPKSYITKKGQIKQHATVGTLASTRGALPDSTKVMQKERKKIMVWGVLRSSVFARKVGPRCCLIGGALCPPLLLCVGLGGQRPTGKSRWASATPSGGMAAAAKHSPFPRERRRPPRPWARVDSGLAAAAKLGLLTREGQLGRGGKKEGR
jgi:hypothetical protein